MGTELVRWEIEKDREIRKKEGLHKNTSDGVLESVEDNCMGERGGLPRI